MLNKNAVSCYDRLETIINRKTPKAQTQPKSEKSSMFTQVWTYKAAHKLWNDLPVLLEIYLQLMLSRRLLKLIYFKRYFPANLLFLSFFYKEGFVNRILKNN